MAGFDVEGEIAKTFAGGIDNKFNSKSGRTSMAVWRVTASAFCLLACATSASAERLHSHGSSSHSKKYKISHLATPERAGIHRRHVTVRSRFARDRRIDSRLSESWDWRGWPQDNRPNMGRDGRFGFNRTETNSWQWTSPQTSWFDNSGYQAGAHAFTGAASYYSRGRRTADGHAFDPNGFTAAHRTLPFGTHVQVVDLVSGRSVVVTITDRGPFVHGRVLDLARGAAQALGMTGRGVTRIRATVM
jgi:rare lipoprotein A